jgi:hypothetical protein
MNNHQCPPGRRQERLEKEQNRLRGVYGDHLKQKQGGMVRIFFQNPQGTGPISSDSEWQSSKITKLKDFILNHKVNIS